MSNPENLDNPATPDVDNDGETYVVEEVPAEQGEPVVEPARDPDPTEAAAAEGEKTGDVEGDDDLADLDGIPAGDDQPGEDPPTGDPTPGG